MWLKVKVNAANKLETVRFCLIVADLATIERGLFYATRLNLHSLPLNFARALRNHRPAPG